LPATDLRQFLHAVEQRLVALNSVMSLLRVSTMSAWSAPGANCGTAVTDNHSRRCVLRRNRPSTWLLTACPVASAREAGCASNGRKRPSSSTTSQSFQSGSTWMDSSPPMP
jgi:hypothetical protein